MIKREELDDPNSCMNQARDDEFTFVLLGRDPAAANAIRYWAGERIRLGKNKSTDPQIIEALESARSIDGISVEFHDPALTVNGSFVKFDGTNSPSLNAAIASKFPDPALTAERLAVSDDALQVLRSFQRDTLLGLADCMIVCAAEIESRNGQVTPEELKRQARFLIDYADTLAPSAPEATR